MKMVTYGLSESVVRTVADRCGAAVCRNFDDLERERIMLLLPQPESPEERIADALLGRICPHEGIGEAE